MSISPTAAATYPTSGSYVNWKNGLDQLVQAVQSGNVTASQQAYATLSQQLGSGNGSASNGQSNPSAQALNQIGTALQSGDIGGAQQALSALQQQLQARPHHHRQHSHGGGNGPVQDSVTMTGGSSSASSANATPSAATSGSGVDVTA